MNKRKAYLYIFILLSVLVSCNHKKPSDSKINTGNQSTDFIAKGRNISNSAQKGLLTTVGKAIKTGGVTYAVEFCNLNAVSIIDSLNLKYNCSISRITNKNRNIKNSLSEEAEKNLWNVFNSSNSSELKDTIIFPNDKPIYYKPIRIGMPTCLKCHGTPEKEILSETLIKINELYPEDKATNYKIGELRGLWKVEFNK